MVAIEPTGMVIVTVYVLIFDVCASCIHGLYLRKKRVILERRYPWQVAGDD